MNSLKKKRSLNDISTWFNSQLINDNIMDEDCLLENQLYKENIDDLIDLNVTKKNYKKLIELCDYLMVDNSDELIDKIIVIHNYDLNIIYEFQDFYKLSKRLKPFETKESLIKAIQLYCKDKEKCFHIYGFISFWDVSNITDMSYLFCNKKKYKDRFSGINFYNDTDEVFVESQFNGDISNWDVSNVINMIGMFAETSFNWDISIWNVSNVTDMREMFYESKFNKNISKWNVSNVTDMSYMFKDSKFNRDISNWNVSNVTHMYGMFNKSKFNGDISNWNVSNVTDMSYMFCDSEFNGDISNWNLSNLTHDKNLI